MDKKDIYRPLLRSPYKFVALELAKELNKTALQEHDDLDVCRLALKELWVRAFPNRPFPADALVLLKRYDRDPNCTIN